MTALRHENGVQRGIHVEVVNGLVSSRQALADFLRRAEDIASVAFLEVDPDGPARDVPPGSGTGRPVIRLVEVNPAAPPAAVAGVIRTLALPEGVAGGLIVCARQAIGRDVGRLFGAGARGFLFVDSPGEEVITAVRAVADGYRFIPSALMTELTGPVPVAAPRRPDCARAALTSREAEVLRMMSYGHSNEEIAVKLFIAQATVRSHVLSILRKLDARNRTEAVVRAYKEGILSIQVEDEPRLVAEGPR